MSSWVKCIIIVRVVESMWFPLHLRLYFNRSYTISSMDPFFVFVIKSIFALFPISPHFLGLTRLSLKHHHTKRWRILKSSTLILKPTDDIYLPSRVFFVFSCQHTSWLVSLPISLLASRRAIEGTTTCFTHFHCVSFLLLFATIIVACCHLRTSF